MSAAGFDQAFWWHVSRSAGIVCWVAVTLSVLWGLALSTKLMGKGVSPTWLLDVHRFLGAFSVVFVTIHLIGIAAASSVSFTFVDLFVPMASTWKPGAVAWGIVAFYALVAVEISSLLMSRIPRSLWRWVHFTSFGVYVMGTVHAFEAGTDATSSIYRWTAIVSVQLVLGMTGLRLLTNRRLTRSLRQAAAAKARGEGPDGVDVPADADAARAARLAALQERRRARELTSTR